MQVKFFCPIWGMVPDYIDRIDSSLDRVFSRVKKAGYDGIEMAVPKDREQKKQIIELVSRYNLELIALQWASTGTTIEEYLTSYEDLIISAAEVKPLFINCHTGRDYFTFSDNCKAIDKAFELAEKLGIPILHEIHRARFTFHAFGTQPYLETYPEIKLTADFSHWCNVSDSYLEDQSKSVNNAIRHSFHIHARVGHPQACQVSDPRAPEWKEALDHHLKWWDEIYEQNKKRNATALTITPEFGPGNYMPLLPYTQQPVANQWEINLWMKDLLNDRYNSKNTA